MVERIRFPHFKPIERQMAQRFVELEVIKGKYEWDVHLETTQSRRMRESGDSLQASEARLYDRRIDCVVEAPEAVWIVEFKERLRPSAVGELIVYRNLYRQQKNPLKPIKLMVVALVDDEGLHDVLIEEGIEWRIIHLETSSWPAHRVERIVSTR
jgi:hypothetical protein